MYIISRLYNTYPVDQIDISIFPKCQVAIMTSGFTVYAMFDLTVSDMFGLVGKCLGWFIIYVCALNFLFKGVKLIIQLDLVGGFLRRTMYLIYGIAVTPLILTAFIIMSPLYTVCMFYTHIVTPLGVSMEIGVDLGIQYTNIIPEFIQMCSHFMATRAIELKK
jgi:hypothetical protein